MFDQDTPGARRTATGYRLFRGVEDPNEVFVQVNFDSVEEAQAGRDRLLASGVLDRWAEHSGPTLVHCAAGKDRTGVLVALVLDVVGVRREAVIADYALSAERVEALFRRWTAAVGVDMPDDLTPHLPRAEVIATVLARLDAEHGGAAGWLRANGLEDDAMERLRARLVDR